MDTKNLVAIDVHTHAEVSSRIPDDPLWQAMQEASARYFKDEGSRPTIPEIAAYYRERKMACVIFPVDMESSTGLVRVPNEEVAEATAENPDVLIPFASIDPAKGRMGAREARRLIEQFGVRGFKFHPSMQAFYPNDRSAYVLYEVIAEAHLPAVFHTGHSGIGTGMRGGGGVRLKYSTSGDKVIHALDRASKPGRRVYRGVGDLPRILNGMGIAVVSTSKGVMSDRKARAEKVGGELLCTVS